MAKLYAVAGDGSLTLAGTTVRLYLPGVGFVGSSDGSVKDAVALTRAEYDALPTKDPNTLYYITDEV
jgi:metal-dependent amidase/aminoacylase/carboxypeptidase family protein